MDSIRLALGDRYRVLYNCLPDYTFPASMSIEDSAGPNSTNDVIPSGKKIILWIGEESTTLTKLLMISSGDEVCLEGDLS